LETLKRRLTRAKKVMLPLTDETLKDLKAGDNVLLTGIMYVGRDAAHKRIVETLDKRRGIGAEGIGVPR
jgi:fumarate hydratase subunit beta